jgi:dTDP-4-amino-4,6-dideoxygalactose transaminase
MSTIWTGQDGRSFEAEFAVCCGAAHAITLTNGSVALDFALQGLGIGVAYSGYAKQQGNPLQHCRLAFQ